MFNEKQNFAAVFRAELDLRVHHGVKQANEGGK